MKKHLMSTLSLTLLLSTPLVLQATPKVQEVHPQGLNPYEQRTELNNEIAGLTQTIGNLETQRDGIAPKQKELTLTLSTKKADAALLVETGKALDALNLLAAQTALLIQEKEKELKTAQAKLPVLAARIKTLEPAADKLELFGKYQGTFAEIKAWNTYSFTTCETTKVPSKDDKTVKVDQKTVQKTDKSAPYLPSKEDYTAIVAQRQKDREASWMNYASSFVYKQQELPSATNKVVTATTAAAATTSTDSKE